MSEVSPEAQLPPEEEQGPWKFPRYLDEFEHVMGPAFTDPVLQELLKNGEMESLPPEELERRQPIYVAFLRILVAERSKMREARRPKGRREYPWDNEKRIAFNEGFDETLTEPELNLIVAKTNEETDYIRPYRDRLARINEETPSYSYDVDDAESDEAQEGEDFFNSLLLETLAEQTEEVADEEPEDDIEVTATVLDIPSGEAEALIETELAEDPSDRLPENLRGLDAESVARDTLRQKPEIVEDLYDHQIPYVQDITKFMYETPQRIRIEQPDGTYKVHIVHGATVDASTGSGKSVLIAKAAHGAEIGKVENGVRNDMLIVVPERALARQFAGIVGDNTFLRFAPEGLIACIVDSSNPRPDPNAQVVITTSRQFAMHARAGLFKGRRFKLLAIDEVHTLTEPLFQQAFLDHWHVPGNKNRPIATIGFSATPYYNEDKDARKLLPRVIKHGDMLTYMDRGILSPGQFFTFLAKPEYASLEAVQEGRAIAKEDYEALRRETLLHSAMELMLPLLRQGRRGIVYCEPGNESGDAIELARRIEELGFRAQAMHSHDRVGLSEEVIERYHSGELDVLTSVATGIMGLNADFNFVGLCGTVNSLVKIKQITGRGVGAGARASEEFPVTTFFHVVAGYAHRNTSTLTFADAVGAELIEQGAIIGPNSTPERSGGGSGGGGSSRQLSGVELDDFPEPIRLALQKIDMYTLQQFNLALNGANQTPIPDNYLPFDAIWKKLKRTDLTPKSLYDRLDRAGYAWQGQLETDEEGNRFLARYYEPAAETFFDQNPIPPRAGDGMKNKSQTAKHLGISEAYLEKTLVPKMHNETDYRGEPRLSERARTFTYYSPDAITWMEEEVALLEEVAETDATQKDICDAIEIDPSVFIRAKEKAQVEPTYKRLPDGKGFRWVYDQEQQSKIAVAADLKPWATDDDWNITRIAREADVPATLVHKKLTAEERAALIPLRTWVQQGKNKKQCRELDHLKEPQARIVVERLKQHKAANDRPWATDDDWSMPRIAQEVGVDPKVINEYLQPEDRAAFVALRAKISPTQSKVLNHLRQDKAQEVVERIKKYLNTPWATDDDWSMSRIAELAGLRRKDGGRVYPFLSNEEAAAVKPLFAHTTERAFRVMDHLPEQHARAVLNRMKSSGESMPIEVFAPFNTIKHFLERPPGKMPQSLKDSSPSVKLPLRKGIRYVTWAGLQRMGELYGRSNSHPDIDFDQMPTKEDQQRLEAVTSDRALTAAEQESMRRILNGRAAQLGVMSAVQLGEPDGIID